MKVLIGFLLAVLIASCQSPRSNEDENTAIAKQMFEAFNKHDWPAMAAYYTPSASFLDPSFGPDYVVKSREETASKYAEMEKMFSNIRDDITGLYPYGDKVIIEFISTGTSSDGQKFKLPIVTVLTFKDGIIVKDATYYDNP
jgi:ketosteroid isomerase-like protein